MSRSYTMVTTILLALSFWLVSGFAFAQTDDQRIAELRQQIEVLEKQAEQYKGNIASQQAKAKSLKGEISILENQIKKIQTQISITSKNINKTGIEIESTETTIFDTQQKISYKKNTVGELILSLYKRDDENLMIVLLKNKNLSDFFQQSQYAANISTSLLGLIGDLKHDKNLLEEQKSNLEGKKSDLESLKRQQNIEKSSLGQATSSKSQLLKRTKGEEAAYQKLLAETEELQRQANLEVFKLEEKMRLAIDPNSLPLARHGILARPVDGSVSQVYGCIETSFARRNYPDCNNGKGGFHNGLDLAASYGTPLRAAENGKVIAVGNAPYAYGVWAAIEHENGLVTAYTHMSVRSVGVGQELKRGDVVGSMGSTGLSTGSHIHFMVYAPKTFTTKQSVISGVLPIGATLNPGDYL